MSQQIFVMMNLMEIFFKLRFTPCKAQQPLRDTELQEKEANKGR